VGAGEQRVGVADALGIGALLETQPDHGQARQLQHQPGALHQLRKKFGRFHKVSPGQALERWCRKAGEKVDQPVKSESQATEQFRIDG
jgi:hypothetical protein